MERENAKKLSVRFTERDLSGINVGVMLAFALGFRDLPCRDV